MDTVHAHPLRLWYVLRVMKALRTQAVKLTLLLALIMPLQGLAAAWGCVSFDAAPASAAAQTHCPHETGTAQEHHNCGMGCCTAAIALLPLPWAAPRTVCPDILLPLRRLPPSVVPDRLDRPPRHSC
jgi:hypothetical protein